VELGLVSLSLQSYSSFCGKRDVNEIWTSSVTTAESILDIRRKSWVTNVIRTKVKSCSRKYRGSTILISLRGRIYRSPLSATISSGFTASLSSAPIPPLLSLQAYDTVERRLMALRDEAESGLAGITAQRSAVGTQGKGAGAMGLYDAPPAYESNWEKEFGSIFHFYSFNLILLYNKTTILTIPSIANWEISVRIQCQSLFFLFVVTLFVLIRTRVLIEKNLLWRFQDCLYVRIVPERDVYRPLKDITSRCPELKVPPRTWKEPALTTKRLAHGREKWYISKIHSKRQANYFEGLEVAPLRRLTRLRSAHARLALSGCR
jgi:hypothetical protein